MAGSLQNQVAIVTGGAGGIGSATVSLLRSRGASVAILDVSENTTRLESIQDQVYIRCNVALEDEVNTAIDTVMQKWGHIDILVNCAGIMDGREPIGEVSNAVWNRVFAINVTGPMFLTRRCVPIFLKQATKGVIINICSVASARGPAAGVAYTAAKHALLGVSRNTAWMYASDGIRCNSVLPGRTDTDILKNSGVSKVGEIGTRLGPYLNCIPGSCTPSDIANAVLFLATAPSVNGAELAVDHGWMTA